MQDYKVKVYCGRIELNLHERGLQKLESTRDAFGTSLLDRLFFILERSGLTEATLAEISGISEEAREIVDIYTGVYFPGEA